MDEANPLPPKYRNLPSWRSILRVFGRVLLGLLFLIAATGPIIAFAIFFEEITSPGLIIDFLGLWLELYQVMIIVACIAMPIGIYGEYHLVQVVRRYYHQKSHVKLDWKPKIAALALIGIGMGAFFYYVPYWYMYLGINPVFGPYIAMHGENGMQISWDTSQAQLSEVRYGKSETNLDMVATGGEYWWEANVPTLHHCVLLSNLEPDTCYYYKITSFDEKIYHFNTPPLPSSGKDVCFTIVGDTQGAGSHQKLLINRQLEKIGASNINFTIICGDLVNQDDNINEWAMLFDKSSYGKIAPYIPWQATSGNHECSCMRSGCDPRGNFKKFMQNGFTYGYNESGLWDVGCYYSFNYSNVHFVILDNFENHTNTFTQRQLEWLDDDLTRNANMWKFISFHLSIYSTSDHGPYPEIQAQLEPLLYKHRVNAIFYGHDHIFEAYHINRTSPEYPGTMAIMCAGGGGSLKPVTNPSIMGARVWNGTKNEHNNLIIHVNAQSNPAITSLPGAQYQLYGERCHHYVQVFVRGNTATISAYRTFDNSLIQAYTLSRT